MRPPAMILPACSHDIERLTVWGCTKGNVSCQSRSYVMNMTDPRLTEIVEGHDAFLRVILSFLEVDHSSSRLAFCLFQAPERSQSRRNDVDIGRGD